MFCSLLRNILPQLFIFFGPIDTTVSVFCLLCFRRMTSVSFLSLVRWCKSCHELQLGLLHIDTNILHFKNPYCSNKWKEVALFLSKISHIIHGKMCTLMNLYKLPMEHPHRSPTQVKKLKITITPEDPLCSLSVPIPTRLTIIFTSITTVLIDQVFFFNLL